MTNKANHAKYICGIRDAIQGSSDDTNLPFIIGSLELYEQCYGTQNKENFRKFLNDALSVYGPGTPFENDDRVIPLYILLGKYSRSSTQAEIFDRMNTQGAYRNSAKFYTEWAKVFTQAGHSTKAKEILSDGIKRKAKPELMLQTALKDLGYSLDENNQPRTIKRPTTTPGAAKHVARIQLFPKGTPIRPVEDKVVKKKANEAASVKPKEDFVFPALPSYSTFDPSRQNENSVSQSLIVLPNFSERENHDDGNRSDSERSEDAENVRPPGAPEEQPIKRRTAGILVPAAGFQLEDYDFYSNDDEDDKKHDKDEANRMNIANNTMPSPSARRPILPSPTARRAILSNENISVPSPSRRQLFPVALPDSILPPRPDPVPSALSTVNTDLTNEFRSGPEALKNLRHDSDSENENEPESGRRLTGFERMMQKRKSLIARPSLAAQKPKVEPLEQLFSRMGVASPGPSQP